LWFSFIFGSYNGAMVVFLTEIMPAHVRVSGFSFAYSLATGIFGGFTPAISTWLIHATGNSAMPGAWLAMAGLMGITSALVLTSRVYKRGAHKQAEPQPIAGAAPITRRFAPPSPSGRGTAVK